MSGRDLGSDPVTIAEVPGRLEWANAFRITFPAPGLRCSQPRLRAGLHIDTVTGARKVITADRGDKPATEEGDAAVGIELDRWAAVG